MALFNFECNQSKELQLRAAKTGTIGCCKNCALTLINGRDYINSNNDQCFGKTTSKFRNWLVLVQFVMMAGWLGGGGIRGTVEG
jgi:uncharacterized protein YlzI (FlbEa/FlbD family)